MHGMYGHLTDAGNCYMVSDAASFRDYLKFIHLSSTSPRGVGELEEYQYDGLYRRRAFFVPTISGIASKVIVTARRNSWQHRSIIIL